MRPILFVDDDDIDVMTIKRVIRSLGVPNQLVCRSDGEEALEYLRNGSDEKPCLILLDLNMPRMSGWELLEIIITDDVLREIPVVILTTSNKRDDIDQANKFDPPIVGFLTKPPGYQKFVEMIRRQLEELNFIQLENATK